MPNIFNYGNSILNENTLSFNLGLFNNRVSFFVGKTLNNIMKELKNVSDINLQNFSNQTIQDDTLFIRNYYYPALINMTVLFKP